ncbi:MAG: AAA domain-containing protein [Fibrobacter sp.]|jgi:MoxR-like ATPase|nr:AAA domain-containing protein [Fibrobacter sp.]
MTDIQDLSQKIKDQSSFATQLLKEIESTVIGQKAMIESILIGFLADGHVLLEGLPGLAKTTAVKAFSDAMSLHFKRIQFTPDLLPADLLGTTIYNAKESRFETRKGPLFSNLVLADEINRAPSKVQSALLEAMQEKTITIGDKTFDLEEPFLVLATQNPIEQEGTYPLPEAQVDRFLLKVKVSYPSKTDEMRILDLVSGNGLIKPDTVASKEDILNSRELVKQVYVDERVREYIVNLVFATRDPASVKRNDLVNYIEVGASPRASIGLAQAAKAHAFIQGRAYVTPEDIKNVAMEVLRHRLILSYEAEAEEVVVETVIQKILDTVEVP